MAMDDNKQPTEVAAYAAAVRSTLVDLPPAERDVLLEDLDDHLAEVAAEGEGSLQDKLGPPAQYASELRTAYGSRPAAVRRTTAADDVRRAIAWLTATDFYRAVRAFLPQLRPAWWVLRGYLAVLVLAVLFSPGYGLGPLPNLTTKRGLVEFALALLAIWLSVRIGQRRQPAARFARLAAWWANGFIAIVALLVLSGMPNQPTIEVLGQGSPVVNQTLSTAFSVGQVTNIYPYTQDGKPLTNVLLYDQEGRPVTLPSTSPDPVTDYPNGADGQPITNAYPLHQHHLDGSAVVPPRVAIPPWPTPSPSPSAMPSPSPTH
jgi:hypothetical protein